MKILFISKQLAGQGGMETIASSVYFGLSGTSQCYFLFLAGSKTIDSAWLSNIHYEVCYTRLPKVLRLFYYKKYLQKRLGKIKPDVIVCLDADSCYVAKTAQNQCPVVSWLHFSMQALKDRDIKRLKKADYHIAIAPGILDQLRSHGINANKSVYIPNFVEPKAECLYKLEKNGRLNLLYVGRIQFETDKYLKDLIDALRGLNVDWQLDLVGDGDDFERCQQYAKVCLGDEAKRMIWHGWQSEPWQYLKNKSLSFDYLVLPSHREGFPMVTIEALSYGIPCICSDIKPGMRDIVREESGILYQCGNIIELHHVLDERALSREWDINLIKQSIGPFYKDNSIRAFYNFLQDSIR